MNDQTQMMNQHQVKINSNSKSSSYSSKKNKNCERSHKIMKNQSQLLVMGNSRIMNQPQMIKQQQPHMPPPQPSQAQMVNQMNQMVSQAQMVPNQPKMMVSQNYAQWTQPPHSMPPMNIMKYPSMNQQIYGGIAKPGRSSNNNSTNWKGKKPMGKRKDGRRKDKILPGVGGGLPSVGPGGGGSYHPPTLYELEQQNRLKARRFYHPKKKFNRMGPHAHTHAHTHAHAHAHAPRNTTSYIIRAKKSGGIGSLVSPCPVTPAVLPTPVFSPSREALVDMAKEEWGVDGYGSMKGLIRLRSPGHDEAVDDYDEEDDEGSSESDVEEHVEVERRLDHDLSRFEMIYPSSGADYHNVLENRVDDQDTHIAQLEEENLILKERLYLMERELGELRRRLLCLERQNQVVEDINEEIVENVSENDNEGLRNISLLVNKHNEEVDSVPGNEIGDSEARRDASGEMLHKELKELAVKEVFHDEVMSSHGTDKQDNGLVNNDGQGYRLVVDNQDDGGQLRELGNNSRVLDSSVGKNINAAVKRRPVEDAYMGETLLDEINRPEGQVMDESGINLKQVEAVVGETEAIGSNVVKNDEAAHDICMGDGLATDKDAKDVESHG